MLVWDRNESLMGNRHKVPEETSASTDSSRSQRRNQQRPSRDRRQPDAKLKKKLVSLEEPKTKITSSEQKRKK